MKYAEKPFPGLPDVGVLHGDGDGPRRPLYWEQFDASLDGSVQQEMLLYNWKQFYASLDKSLQQEML